jgi:hypothetical protein
MLEHGHSSFNKFLIMLKLLKINPDMIGYTSAALCTVHCFATPFIFITQACSKTCCAETPLYWQAIDYLFLAISFSAVFFAVKKWPFPGLSMD